MKDRTNKNNSNNVVINKENEKESSSYAVVANGCESDVELLEVDEVLQQQKKDNINSKTTESRTKASFDKAKLKNLSRISEVWKYAIREDDPNYATCCLCKEYKRISTNNGSTSTLRRHLILKHKLKDLILPNIKTKRSTLSMDPIRKQQLHNLSVDCIVRDSRTFNDFEKPGIKRLLQEFIPGYDPPTRHTVIRRLKHLHVYHQKKLIEDLKNVHDISITMDLWSNKQMRSFLVITGHYFCENSGGLRSTVLNFSTFDKQHLSSEISRALETKLKELNILQKVTRVTCDGGRNVVSAIDNIHINVKRLWCVAHRLHLTITNGLGFWKVKKEESEDDILIEEKDLIHEINGEEENVTSLDGYQNTVNMNMSIDDNLELDDYEPMDTTDFNDNEELITNMDEEVTDNWTEDVNESDVDIVYDQEIIVNLLRKCRGLISMIKRSTIITLFFDNERKILNTKRSITRDVKSRWNSTFTMIDSLLSLREIVEKLFNYKSHLNIKPKQRTILSRFELTSDEWNVLSNLHFILQPFFHATKVMSGSQYPSIGIALYLLTHLKNFLQQHETNEDLIIKRSKQLLSEKFLYYFERDNEQFQLLKLHAYFDPAGFAVLSDSEKRSIEQNIKILAASETYESIECVTAILTSNKSNASEHSNKSAIDMFNESVGELTHEKQRHANKKSTITDEFNNYRKLATQFNLKHRPDTSSSTIFWKTYEKSFSILERLAKKMLSLPATSVPSESCFSITAYIGRKERTRLTGKNLSSSVFLKDKIDS
ncbi:unnamed protein product [Rotaria magnacalcarata]